MGLILISYIKLFLIIFFLYIAVGTLNSLHLGLMADKYSPEGLVDVTDTHILAALRMAIKEINNKSDGIYDFLLPNTSVFFSLKEPQGDFLISSNIAQDLGLNVFNGNGVDGIIGTGHDISSRAASQIFGFLNRNLYMIDYGASSSDLSHGIENRYFGRVCSSDGVDGLVLARLLKFLYSWNVVNVFSTTDTYGTDNLSGFILECQKLGISIENEYSFFPGTTDFSSIINRVKSKGILRVFVLLLKSEDAGALLESMYAANLLDLNTQIVGTRYMLSTDTWNAMSASAPVRHIFHGAVGIEPYVNRSAVEFKSFISRFLSQKNTKFRNRDQSLTCSKEMDDDRSSYLYYRTIVNNKLPCTGVMFDQLSEDDVEDEVAFAYDAIYTMFHAYHDVLYTQGIAQPRKEDIEDAAINRVNFTGATGHVDLFEGFHDGSDNGRGDRVEGLHFTVTNFNPFFYHKYGKKPEAAVRKIGVFDVDLGFFEPCNMDMEERCSEPDYNTVGDAPVEDTPLVVIVQMRPVLKSSLRIGASLALLTTALFLAIQIYYYDTKLMRSSQPSIMLLVLLGATLSSLQVIVMTLEITDSVCVAAVWMGHLAFALVFVSLLVKVWRIGNILKGSTARAKVTATNMYQAMALGMMLFIGLLAVDTAVSRPHMSYDESFDGHNLVRLIKCKKDSRNVTYMLYVIEGVMLFYGARLCWGAKDAPSAVNDSTSITLSLYLILFVCAVTFPLVFLSIDPNPQNLQIVQSFGFVVSVVGVSVLLFGNRIKQAVEGAEINEHFQIVGNVKEGESTALTTAEVAAKFRDKVRSRIASKKSSGPVGGPSVGSAVNRPSIGRAASAVAQSEGLANAAADEQIKNMTKTTANPADDKKHDNASNDVPRSPNSRAPVPVPRSPNNRKPPSLVSSSLGPVVEESDVKKEGVGGEESAGDVGSGDRVRQFSDLVDSSGNHSI